MAKSVKSIIKKVLSFGVLGIIAVYLLYGAVDTLLHYYRRYITLGANLPAEKQERNTPFLVMDMEGEWYGGEWNTPSAVPNLAGEVVFVNPDGSEEVIWRNEKCLS